MKSISKCYTKHSIQISDSYCSGSSLRNSNPSSSTSQNLITPSVQDYVTCVYRSISLNQDDSPILTSLIWSSNLVRKGFNIQIMQNSLSSSDHLRKSKGSKTITFQSGSRFEVEWDLSNAEYENGPEPTSNYYIMVCKNSVPILVLSDYEEHNLSPGYETFTLVSRTISFSGSTLLCMVKSKFCDTGKPHDIMITYLKDEETGQEDYVLTVSVDKKKVVNVKNLQWNFRGNQCVFLDGIVVDLMWDMHDWLLNPVSGNGLFLFRTRSGIESRLWLLKDERSKEKMREKEQAGFSLMIIACKKPSS